MSKYYKRDMDYYIIQERSLLDLLDTVKRMLEEHNYDKDNKTLFRVEGGILHEESLGTYAQVVVEVERVEVEEWI